MGTSQKRKDLQEGEAKHVGVPFVFCTPTSLSMEISEYCIELIAQKEFH